MNSDIYSKCKKNIFLLFLTTFISLIKAEEPLNKEFEQYLDRIENIINKMPEFCVYEERILQGKRLILNDIIFGFKELADQGEEKDAKNPESYFYDPKYPKPLSDEEKKQNINKRIAKKFIGELPKHIEDLVAYFSNHAKWLNCPINISNRALLKNLYKVKKHRL